MTVRSIICHFPIRRQRGIAAQAPLGTSKREPLMATDYLWQRSSHAQGEMDFLGEPVGVEDGNFKFVHANVS